MVLLLIIYAEALNLVSMNQISLTGLGPVRNVMRYLMSDELRQQAEQNRILEIIGGSHLYGTSTPSSDQDFVGIFLPPLDYVLGLKSVQEVELGIKDKSKDGKNTAEAIDRKLYEFRKFLNLALGSNPNIIELLFANEDAIVYLNSYGEQLLNIRHHFPSKMCMQKFIGYAHSQKHKMTIRRDHFNELRDGYGFLGLCDPKLTMGQVYDRMIDCDTNCKTFTKKETGMHIHCGDICFEPGVYAKKAMKMLKERLDKATNRSELVLKHGYDTKFASHLIRLLQEGLMLLEHGELMFPLPTSELLLEIKHGKWEIQQVLELADKLEAKMDQVVENTTLPSKPNFKAVEEVCINIMQSWLANPL